MLKKATAICLMLIFLILLCFPTYAIIGKELVYEENFNDYSVGMSSASLGFTRNGAGDGNYSVASDPAGAQNKCIKYDTLTDGDAYLIKTLPQMVEGTVSFDISLYVIDRGYHQISFLSQAETGEIIIPFYIAVSDGVVVADDKNTGINFSLNKWVKLNLTVDTEEDVYTLKIDDKPIVVYAAPSKPIKYMTGFRFVKLSKNAPFYFDDISVSYSYKSLKGDSSTVGGKAKVLPLVKVKNNIINVSETGAFPNDDIDDSAQIHCAIESAIATGSPTTVVFDKGRYKLGKKLGTLNSAIGHLNAKNITLKGNGAELFITDPYIGGISFVQSDGITIEDFIINYETPPWAQGVVEEINKEKKYFIYRVDKGYDILKDPRFTRFDACFGMIFDKDDNRMLKKTAGDHFFISGFTMVQPLLYQMNVSDAYVLNQMDTGDKVSFSNRGMSGGSLDMFSTSRITVRNVKVYESGGCLFIASNVNGDVIIDNLSSQFEGENWLTSNADGVHIQSVRGKVILQNSVMEGVADDCINLYQVPGPIIMAVSPTELLMTQEARVFPQVGDTITVYDPSSGLLKGKSVIQSSIIEANGSQCRVILSTPIKNIVGGGNKGISDEFYIDECMQPGTIIKDNIFRKSRRYGALLKSKDTTVENNLFQDLGDNALHIASFLGAEGPHAENLIVKNNVFNNSGYRNATKTEFTSLKNGAIMLMADGKGYYKSPYRGLKNVLIENNSFVNMPQYAISGRSLDGLKILNNTFTGEKDERIVAKDVGTIYLENSNNIQIKGNKIKDYRDKIIREIFIDRACGTSSIGENEFDIPSTAKDIEFESPIPKYDFEINKIPNQITIDGDLSDWRKENTFTIGKAEAKWFGNNVYAENDCAAKGKLAWDEKNLYVGIEVLDDVHIQNQSIADSWKDDSIQFALDPERLGIPGALGYVEAIVAFGNDGITRGAKFSRIKGISNGEFQNLNAMTKRFEETKTTVYEFLVPWSELLPSSVKFTDGTYLGFTLLVNDNDTTSREGFVEFFSGIGAGKNPALYGTAILAYEPGSAPKEKNFDDIELHWAKREIELMAYKKILSGKSNNLFAPDENVSLAEFIAMVVRHKGYNIVKYMGGINDINYEDWYANIIQTAFDEGILDGGFVNEGYISPNKPINRGEAASILARAFSLSKNNIIVPDIQSAPIWLRHYIVQVASNDIIKGYEDGNFVPNGNLTRAQAAVILNRLLMIN